MNIVHNVQAARDLSLIQISKHLTIFDHKYDYSSLNIDHRVFHFNKIFIRELDHLYMYFVFRLLLSSKIRFLEF